MPRDLSTCPKERENDRVKGALDLVRENETAKQLENKLDVGLAGTSNRNYLNDLDDLDDLDEENDPEQFRAMLTAHKLNPFMAWESHRDLLADDPGYHALDSNELRKSTYQLWAAEAQSARNDLNADDESDDLALFCELVRQKYKPGRFYIDFKRKLRDNPAFKNAMMPDKLKEKYYREYGVFYKRPEPEKTTILARLARKHQAEKELVGRDKILWDLFHIQALE